MIQSNYAPLKAAHCVPQSVEDGAAQVAEFTSNEETVGRMSALYFMVFNDVVQMQRILGEDGWHMTFRPGKADREAGVAFWFATIQRNGRQYDLDLYSKGDRIEVLFVKRKSGEDEEPREPEPEKPKEESWV